MARSVLPWLAALVALWMSVACDDLSSMRNAPGTTDGDADTSLLTDGDVATDTDVSAGDTDHLPLDAVLTAAEARAGMLTGAELAASSLNGPNATAEAGDYKLYNSHVAFIVDGLNGTPILAAGGVKDAAALTAAGKPAFDDPLVEAVPVIAFAPTSLPGDGTVRLFKVSAITLIHNGANGKTAHLRLEGTDAPFAPLDTLLAGSGTNAMYNPMYKVFIDYYLDPDSVSLRMEMTFALDDPTGATTLEVARPGFAVLTDRALTGIYAEQVRDNFGDFDSTSSLFTREGEWWAQRDDTRVVGVYDVRLSTVLGLFLPTHVDMAFHGQDLRFASGETKTAGVNLYVGSTLEAMRQSANAARVSPEARAAVSGTAKAAAAFEAPPFVRAWRQITSTGSDGSAVVTERLSAETRAGDDGVFSLQLGPGDYRLQATSEAGQVGEGTAVTVASVPVAATLSAPLAAPSAAAQVKVAVLESMTVSGVTTNVPVAARVDVVDPTADSDSSALPLLTAFSPDYDGTNPNATLTLTIPLGNYGVGATRGVRIVVSRGPLYDAQMRDITLTIGQAVSDVMTFTLARVVNPTYSYTNTAQQVAAGTLVPVQLGGQSGLGPIGTPTPAERLRGVQAEGMGVFFGADAFSLASYTPTLSALALSASAHPVWAGTAGTSLVTSAVRLYGYGLTPAAATPALYGIATLSYTSSGSYSGRRLVPALIDELRTNQKATLVELGSPRQGNANAFMDFIGYDPKTGLSALGREGEQALESIDLFQVMNGAGNFAYTYPALQDWYSLIAQGHFIPAVGHSDIPGFNGAGREHAGWPQTFVYQSSEHLSADSPASILSALKAGHAVVSGGPIIHFSIGTALPGDTVNATTDSTIALPDLYPHIRIESGTDTPVDFAYLCVNGTDAYYMYVGGSDPNARLDIDAHLPIPHKTPGDTSTPYQDSWAVVIAAGSSGATNGQPYAGLPSFSITNPIFIEADGQAGLSFPSVPTDKPMCMSERLCDLFANYDLSRTVVATANACCGLYPQKEYCTATSRRR